MRDEEERYNQGLEFKPNWWDYLTLIVYILGVAGIFIWAVVLVVLLF